MNELEELKEKGLLRVLRTMEQSGREIGYQGKSYLNLSSNDYLGISARIDLQKEFLAQLDTDRYLMGGLSSRLLTGTCAAKEELEGYIAQIYGGEASLVYNSGYHANIGILPALVHKEDLIIADKLVHASIIDGLKLASCEWQRFRHNDYNDLESKLKQAQGKYRTIIVVTESIFSMDGDCADLYALAELKKRYPFLLYVDEAHAVGVRGDKGLGLAEELGLLPEIDLLIGTLGKAVASEGAFVVCSSYFRQLLINKSRSFIFTTASAPINALWTRFILEKITSMRAERQHLREITNLFRNKLRDFNLTGETHIVPLVLTGNEECNRYSAQLQEANVLALPVRYPTVPINKPRIRFSLTAALQQQDIQKAYETILAQKGE